MIRATIGILASQGGVKLLLDQYSGAAAAYSLRLLSSTYTGDAIRVRRASDNNEQDIGFVNNELDTSTLITFCSGTNGFVKTWYDQSGNGYDATQITALNQPQIVSSGSVILENGKPIIKGTDNTDFLVIDNSIPRSSNMSIFYSMSLDTTSTIFVAFANGVNNAFMIAQQNSTSTVVNGNVGSPSVFKNSNSYTVTTRGAVYDDFQGQKLLSLIGGSTQNLNPFNLGYGVGLDMFNSQEVIIYNSNQSSNRTGIETNINAQYNIYWDGSQTSLLDTYSGSAAAYSLRALSSAYTGPLVRVRRASDNAEQDIYAKYDGSLNVSALEAFCSGTNGFVKTWYDQSGNGYDATQTTASNQPQIVSAGSVILENGKPSVQFDGSDDWLATSVAYPTQQYLSNFYLASSTATNGRVLDTRGTGSSVQGWHNKFSNSQDITILDDGVSSFLDTSNITRSGQKLVSVLAYGGSGSYINEYTNGSLEQNVNDATTRDFDSGNNLYIATNVNGQDTQFFIGKLQEIVSYTTDQSSNRTGISTNINDFYSIY